MPKKPITKKLSTKYIQKTLNLSQEFDNYMIKHPHFLDEASGRYSLVMGDSKDIKFTNMYLKFGQKIAREEHKKVHQIIHMKKGWRIINVLKVNKKPCK